MSSVSQKEHSVSISQPETTNQQNDDADNLLSPRIVSASRSIVEDIQYEDDFESTSDENDDNDYER